MITKICRGFGLLGIGATVLVLAQGNGGIPAGTTRYKLNVPSALPPPPIPHDNQLTVEGVALGLRLFNDKLLSGNNTQACASCHTPVNSFSDRGKAVSTGSNGAKGTRNAMALFNLAYAHNYFWDGRSPSLRDQALGPIQNPVEMNQTLDALLKKLNADSTYPAQFAKAFGSKGITAARVGLALEQYEETLLAGNSKFDLFQQGLVKLTAQEDRGRVLFTTPFNPKQGQFGADCARCHGGPLMTDFKFRNNGLDSQPTDLGLGGVTGLASDNGKFKTPSVRNLTVTGPYMHDGRFQTLEQVVQHYSSGVVQSATLDPGMAKEKGGGVQLSASDQAALVAFLKTLVEPQYQSSPGRP